MEGLLEKYQMLDEQNKKLLDDFLEFLVSKSKEEKNSKAQMDYTQRLQTIFHWSGDDVAYLKDIKKKYNWGIEEW